MYENSPPLSTPLLPKIPALMWFCQSFLVSNLYRLVTKQALAMGARARSPTSYIEVGMDR